MSKTITELRDEFPLLRTVEAAEVHEGDVYVVGEHAPFLLREVKSIEDSTFPGDTLLLHFADRSTAAVAPTTRLCVVPGLYSRAVTAERERDERVTRADVASWIAAHGPAFGLHQESADRMADDFGMGRTPS